MLKKFMKFLSRDDHVAIFYHGYSRSLVRNGKCCHKSLTNYIAIEYRVLVKIHRFLYTFVTNGTLRASFQRIGSIKELSKIRMDSRIRLIGLGHLDLSRSSILFADLNVSHKHLLQKQKLMIININSNDVFNIFYFCNLWICDFLFLQILDYSY